MKNKHVIYILIIFIFIIGGFVILNVPNSGPGGASMPKMLPFEFQGIEVSDGHSGKAIIVVGDEASKDEIEAAKKIQMLVKSEVQYNVVPIMNLSELSENDKNGLNLIIIGTPQSNELLKSYNVDAAISSVVEVQTLNNTKNLVVVGRTGDIVLKAVSEITGAKVCFDDAKNIALNYSLIKKYQDNFPISKIELLGISDIDGPAYEIIISMSGKENKMKEGHVFVSANTGDIIDTETEGSYLEHYGWEGDPELTAIADEGYKLKKEEIEMIFPANETLDIRLLESSKLWIVAFYSSGGVVPSAAIIAK